MINLIIFTVFVIIYMIFFFMNRKKAILLLFFIKLPMDQLTWNINIPIPLAPLKASEAFGTFIMILILVTFMLDSLKESDRRGFFRSIPSVLIVPISLFMILILISLLRGGILVLSLSLFLKLTTGIVIGTYVAKTFDSDEDIDWLVRCMLFGTIAISILSIPAVFSGEGLKFYAPTIEDQYIGTPKGGGIGHYYSGTSFAEAFLVNASSILLASIVLKSKWEKLLCLLAILFSIVAIFVSANRSGWITLALVLIIWMVVKRRWKLIVISAFCILVIATAQMFSNPLQKAYQRISYESDSLEKGKIPDNSFGGRPLIWKTYMAYFMEAPMLEKLIGGDRIIYMGMKKMSHDPHNDYLYILIKMGIIGLAITLFLYIVTFYYILRAMLVADNDYDWDLALTAILAFFTLTIPAFTRTGLMNPNFEWTFWSFTMLALKKYMSARNIEYQDEESMDIDDESTDSILEEQNN
jgi:O-antigen ligase